uniref:Uncharacterized protein n=1 Tax=Octopus bimaculoides TaxID=37653 RepID=A0A0L8HZ22_OCTBM
MMFSFWKRPVFSPDKKSRHISLHCLVDPDKLKNFLYYTKIKVSGFFNYQIYLDKVVGDFLTGVLKKFFCWLIYQFEEDRIRTILGDSIIVC